MKAVDTVKSLEKEALKGWSSGNALAYGIHAHPDSIYFDNLGAQNQIEGNDNIRKYVETAFSELPAHNYEIVGLKARQYGDTVILSYQYHPTLLDGIPLSKWATTVVYALFGPSWKMVHASWIMLMPPPQ